MPTESRNSPDSSCITAALLGSVLALRVGCVASQSDRHLCDTDYVIIMFGCFFLFDRRIFPKKWRLCNDDARVV